MFSCTSISDYTVFDPSLSPLISVNMLPPRINKIMSQSNEQVTKNELKESTLKPVFFRWDVNVMLNTILIQSLK